MLLDDALFGQITTALAGEAAATTAVTEQRRREPRVGVNATVTVIPISDSLRIMPFDVPVRDLSAGGIGFFHTERIGLNEQFAVLLPDGRESVAVLCEVAHYQRLADRQFAVGAGVRGGARARGGGGVDGGAASAFARGAGLHLERAAGRPGDLRPAGVSAALGHRRGRLDGAGAKVVGALFGAMRADAQYVWALERVGI
jgi:hypothetical protein